MWPLFFCLLLASGAVEFQPPPPPQNFVTEPLRSFKAADPLDALFARLDVVQRSQRDVFARLDTVQQALRAGTESLRPRGRVLGRRCRRDGDCRELVAHSTCSARGRCKCARGFQKAAGGLCRQLARLGEECRADRHCRAVKHAVCVGGRCSCPDGFWSDADKCQAAVEEGQPCSDEQDCSAHLQNFTCTAGVCAVRMCPSVGVEKIYSNKVWLYRLSGGTSCDNGNVLMSEYDNSWHASTCDSDWTKEDATVVCRSLGFRSGTPKPGALIGKEITRLYSHLGYVCNGTENSLRSCPILGYGKRSSCLASEFAAVTCQ